MENNTKKPRVLGIIPARGRSKRLPRKNIIDLDGKPLIAYSIESALGSKALDKVIVSTDDQEIADISKKFGAEVPFLRPKEIAMDDTPDGPVLLHTINFFKEKGINFDYVVLLRPTSPLRATEDINNIVRVAIETGFDLVRGVTLAEGVAHPYWMYKRGESNELKPLFDDYNVSTYYRGQMLPKIFFQLNGVVDIFSRKQIETNKNILIAEHTGYIEIPKDRCADIDDITDLEITRAIINARKIKR